MRLNRKGLLFLIKPWNESYVYDFLNIADVSENMFKILITLREENFADDRNNFFRGSMIFINFVGHLQVFPYYFKGRKFCEQKFSRFWPFFAKVYESSEK